MRTQLWTRTALIIAAGLLLCGATPGRLLHAASAAPDVRVSHDSYPDHVEPSVAVNPRNPNNLLGAAMFIRGMNQPVVPGAFASFDGGHTWRDDGALPLPHGTTYGDDVTVAFNGRGVGYVCAMAAIGLQHRSDRGVYVWRTDDGGRTFHAPVAAMRHQFADHPGLAADNAPGADDLYTAWVAEDHATLGFSRSLDGGRRFEAPRNISAPSGGVSSTVVAAGPHGAVYVAYESQRQGADVPTETDAPSESALARRSVQASHRGHAGSGAVEQSRRNTMPRPVMDAQVEVVASSDYGRTFRRHAVLGPVPSNLAPAPGISLPTGPSIATDPRDGSVYVAYATYRAGSAHVDIMVAHSQDRGRTWSVPLRITTDPVTDGITYFQPQVAVDDAGGVDVTSFALTHGRVAVILARSTTGGTRFVSRLDVTDSPFDPRLGLPGGGKHGRWWIGDYQGLAAGGGMIHPFWNDTRTGHLDIFTAAISVTAAH